MSLIQENKRIARERKTIGLMIQIFCNDKHNTKDNLCEECNELKSYSNIRLDKCPYGVNKTTCNKCPIHCYKPEMRERVREVMRYSGPKMSYKHPILAFHHITDGLRKPKLKEKEKK